MAAVTGQSLYNAAMELSGAFNSGVIQQGNQADFYFNKAILEVINNLYNTGQTQSVKDELYGLITTGFEIPVINPATNSIYLSPITAYFITYSNGAGVVTLTVTTILPHNLITGQWIEISGLQWTTSGPGAGAGIVTVSSNYIFTVTISGTSVGSYITNSGVFYAVDIVTQQPLQLLDYYHLLNAETTYLDPIYPPVGIPTMITNATNTATVRVSLFTYNKLRSKDNLTLAGFSLNTNANGTFYINKVNDTEFDLYSDSEFQTPVAGNGNFVSTDPMTMAITYVRNAKPYMPDEKISMLSQPTEDSPRYLESDIMLKFYPQPTSVLQSVVLDYIRLPIDVYKTNPAVIGSQTPYSYIKTLDAILDLSTYYHPRFLLRLPEAVVNYISRMSADEILQQQSGAIQQQNT